MGQKILSMTLAIILTAVVSGGGVYIWLNNKITIDNNQKETITTEKETPVQEQQVVKEEIKKDITQQEITDPLLYQTNGGNVELTKGTSTFDFTAADLESMANECGSTHEAGYFNRLVEAYKDTPKTTYNFKFKGESQGSDTFIATLLLNRMEYLTLDAVKKDFDLCAAGGEMYPTAMNSKWLLFINSCGTGFDDGSGKPSGCEEARKVVEPTLKLNPANLEESEISAEE
jgi:hypothetical protein